MKQLKYFKITQKQFARLNNTRFNKSVLLNNNNNTTTNSNEDQEVNFIKQTKAK